MAAMCADLPELGLLSKESRPPGLDQNGYEPAFIQNNYAVSIISDRYIIWPSNVMAQKNTTIR